MITVVSLGAAGCTESRRAGNATNDAGAAAAAVSGSPDSCRGLPLPADQSYVPAGLCASVVASGLTSVRQIAFAPNGDLFAASERGAIRLLRDRNGDGAFDASEITAWADTGGNGNNCHIDVEGGFVYAGTPGGVARWPYAPGSASGGMAQDVVVGEPGGGAHPLHTVHVYDGYLYVHSGSAENATNDSSPDAAVYDTLRSLLRRFPLSSFAPGHPFAWESGEIVAQGLRNMVGFTRTAAGRMFGVVNGLDDVKYQGRDMHTDNPGEQVVALGMGTKFGYPFCFTAQRVVTGSLVAPGTQLANGSYPIAGVDDAWCAANAQRPVTFVQAHSAPLDIAFFEQQPRGSLPERWRGGAFVSLHGSWDRVPPTGYKVVWIPFDSAGHAPMPTSTSTQTTFPYEVVFGGGNAAGAVDGPWTWKSGSQGETPRPVGVAVSPVDGALYISSDVGGYLYRVAVRR